MRQDEGLRITGSEELRVPEGETVRMTYTVIKRPQSVEFRAENFGGLLFQP